MLGFYEKLKAEGNIEKQPVLEGRNMSMIIAPKTEKEKEKEAKAARLKQEQERSAQQTDKE